MSKEKKPKEKKFNFSTVLMIAEQPSIPNGEIYTHDILRMLVERISIKPYIIVQEMNQVERKIKNIPLAEPWDKKIMATVISAELIDGKFIIHCETRLNRDGRKLAGIIKENGIDSIVFFPVGYGVPGPNGVLAPNYKLNYVAIEPKKM